MKKNTLLNVAILICQFICLLQILTFVVATVVLVHWHFDPDYYSNFNLNITQKSTLGYASTAKWSTDTAPATDNHFALSNIKTLSLYFLYLQLTAIVYFVFMTLRAFLRIIQSVKSDQSFLKTHVIAFRKIGKYLFCIFLLSSFSIIFSKWGNHFSINLEFTPLILMLVAYILAEIFKEGNTLSEENQLTV